MKIHYRVNDRLNVELEGNGQKEVFKELSTLQEIFGENRCGLCDKDSIRFVVRNVDDNDYYELRCDCGGVLSFGQHRKGGTLFPKRKDDDGNYLPNKGWHKWTKDNKSK